MEIREIAALLLTAAGMFFLIASTVGVLRLPDFYTRLHASGNCETLGLMLSILGIAVYETSLLLSLKLIIIFLLVFVCNPIGTHVLGRAAYKADWPVWQKDMEDSAAEFQTRILERMRSQEIKTDKEKKEAE